MSPPSAAFRSSFETYLHISFAREAAGKCRSIITRTSLSVAAVITPETMSSLGSGRDQFGRGGEAALVAPKLPASDPAKVTVHRYRLNHMACG